MQNKMKQVAACGSALMAGSGLMEMCSAAQIANPQQHPNILWIMDDQHNANCLSCAGHPNVRTPNLDRLAARGTRMTSAYCNNPICGPSRASFLSGQYVKTHGISGNTIREVQSEAPNMARRFKEAGYQTAMIGKAHLPISWVKGGFEYIRLSDLCDADRQDPRSCAYFDDLVDAGLGDWYDQGILPPEHRGFKTRSFISNLPEYYSLEAWTGREACRFFDQMDTNRPFFAQVSFQRPHDPYAPPPERAGEYQIADIQLPPGAEDYLYLKFAGKPAFQQEYVRKPVGGGYPQRCKDADDLRLQMSRYFTLINMIDGEIGNVLANLDEKGLLDNTIVVFHTDHGDFAGEHGLMLKNLGIYESIQRIPWIMAGPGIPAGKVHDGMIESVDLYPTLAELAGIAPEKGVDGVSRVRDLQTGAGKEFVIAEFDFYSEPQTRVYAVRDDRFRLVTYDDAPEDGELYDHMIDPDELNNRFNDLAFRADRDRLSALITDYRKGTRRVHTPQDDLKLWSSLEQGPTWKIHKKTYKWSDLLKESDVGAGQRTSSNKF